MLGSVSLIQYNGHMPKGKKLKEDRSPGQLALDERARKEVDCLRASLRRMVEEKKIQQLHIQQKLGWGPGYVSQMYGGTKELRFEPFFQVLYAADIEPVAFFAAHYQWSGLSGEGKPAAETPGDPAVERLQRQLDQLRGTLDNVVRALLERNLISVNDIERESDDGLLSAGTGKS